MNKISTHLNEILKHIDSLAMGDNTSSSQSIDEQIDTIEASVRRRKDAALIDYARRWDKVVDPAFSLTVTSEEIDAAYQDVPDSYIDALKEAYQNIFAFHKRQVPANDDYTESDYRYGVRYTPISSVALYVPGGRAVYPSSVLMNAIPSQLAGVKRRVILTPPRADGKVPAAVLVAADICGIQDIRKVGGAQAVFAACYGTESIPAVDKIVGPGNIFVTKAKQRVQGRIAIDKAAGPSEVLVYVNDAKYAKYAASELLAQLEHDPLAIAVAVSENTECLLAIQAAVDEQLPTLSRQEILKDSLANLLLYQAIDDKDALRAINEIASEHLVLLMDDYDEVLNQVENAGSIFCGPYSPVALGDYFAGPNHVLPTGRTSRYSSPLGVMDFMKYSSYLSYSKEKLLGHKETLKTLIEPEGLDAHYRSVEIRDD